MSKEEVGRYYERLVGYHYEKNGWKILYNGMLKGLKDKGIDLVGTRGNEKIIIQAKGWRHTSIIDWTSSTASQGQPKRTILITTTKTI